MRVIEYLSAVAATMLLMSVPLMGQVSDIEQVQASYGDTLAMLMTEDPGYGYGYNQLLQDIYAWRSSPMVTIDSIGHSVMGRTIWEVRITDAAATTPKRTVTIHARTHPNEVQSSYLVNAVIAWLLSDEPWAITLRSRVDFHIIPMLNPDGVELLNGRVNANMIDLERNWDKSPMEPEVAALKAKMIELMSGVAPVEVALNLHSASACKRYFVYHDASGTSQEFAVKQQSFIDGVRNIRSNGIEPWGYFVSWVGSAPTHFPESWWWFNHGTSVMALTYEDMHCAEAGGYDTTARAILLGIADWLAIPSSIRRSDAIAQGLRLSGYPNPFSSATTIGYSIPSRSNVAIVVTNVVGRVVESVSFTSQPAGNYEFVWRGGALPTGPYLCTIRTDTGLATIRMMLVR